jgi:hypothetical protein
VIAEHDDRGRPYVPAYCSSRIYVDLSDLTTYGENFERLVRWLYEEPLHRRPELGAKPPFLVNDRGAIRLGTSARFRRAIDGFLPFRNELIEFFATAALYQSTDDMRGIIHTGGGQRETTLVS